VVTFPIKKRINAELFELLLKVNRGFIHKREIKKLIKKLFDLSEKDKLKLAGKYNAGMKKLWEPVWNDLHYMEGKTN